jgi:NTE family protein
MPSRFSLSRAALLRAFAATALVLAGCASAPPQEPTAPVTPVPTPSLAKVPPRVGLALGGGAARGFAHVGVIEVLEEAGIKPDLVVGTSAGSVVAALYASGRTGAQLQAAAMNMDEAAFADWMLPFFNRGVLRGEALARYVDAQVGHKLIENMTMPLGIVATDLKTGQGVLFRRGDTGTAVRASSSVPAVFLPVKIGTQEYVDGGLVAPVPVRYARDMGAEVVVAVDISSAPEGNPSGDPFQILLQTFAIMSKSINSWELHDADVVVRPALAGMSSADFASKRRAIEAGRAAMLAALPKLRAAMAAKAHLPS